MGALYKPFKPAAAAAVEVEAASVALAGAAVALAALELTELAAVVPAEITD